VFYRPDGQGYEKTIMQYLDRIRGTAPSDQE